MPEENNTNQLSLSGAEVANVSALMDSVYAIDQALLNETELTDESIQQVLKLNFGHIKLQLSKQVYQDALTQEQKDTLNDASTRAKAAFVKPNSNN